MARRGRRKGNGGSLLLAAVVAMVLLALAVAGGWWLGRQAAQDETGVAAVVPDVTGADTAAVNGASAAAAPANATPHRAGAAAKPAAAVPMAAQAPPDLPPAAAGAHLAVILDDCGQNLNHLDEVLALPFPVTLAIMPRQPQSLTTAQKARAAGKPIMLHQPMEPLAGANGTAPNPGPGAIMAATPPDQVAAVLTDNLASAGNPPGFNNHMGSRVTANQELMRAVMQFAKNRNLFFIDSWTSGQSVAMTTAHAAGVRTARNEVFLDNQDDYAYVTERLRLAARKAAPGAAVVAIGHITRQQTWRVLRDAAGWLKASGIALVPAADLAR